MIAEKEFEKWWRIHRKEILIEEDVFVAAFALGRKSGLEEAQESMWGPFGADPASRNKAISAIRQRIEEMK